MNPLPTGFEPLRFSTKAQLCELLERVQILIDFSRREIETLSPYMEAYKIAPHTEIFREGMKDNFLCLLAEGTVEVLKRQTDDTRCKLATIRAGKSIGEMAFLDHQPHSASVVSIGEAVVLLLTEKGYQRLREENPRLALNLLWHISQLLSHRLRQTSGQLVDYL